MTTNLPPVYNQQSQYSSYYPQGYSRVPLSPGFNSKQSNLNTNVYQNQRAYIQRPINSNIRPSYQDSRDFSPINFARNLPSQNLRGVSPINYQQKLNPQFVNRPINQIPIQRRQNNFVPQTTPVIGQQNYARSPSPIYQQPYSMQGYQAYQQPYMPYNPQQQNVFPPQNYGSYNNLPSSYYQTLPQNYTPLYTSNPGVNLNNYQGLNNMVYNQLRKNNPQQSINSNFSYENANFDVNYSVQQNLVHCVICNQTYKANQKKQHLQLHREKVKNVNIRPVDEKQLNRLQKYNSMSRKGLIVKPIVQPDEFNVQYNPNEFVLKKITQYRDIDGPHTKQVNIQTGPNNIQESPSRSRNRTDSPSRIDLIQENQNNRQTQRMSNNNPRITNTRFNNESVRQEQKIFLSDKFNDSKHQGEGFKSNYNPNQSYLNQSQRRSSRPGSPSKNYGDGVHPSQYGYQQDQSNLKYRNAESVIRNSTEEYGYEKKGSLHNVNQQSGVRNVRNNSKTEITLGQIIEEAQRHSDQ